MLNNTPRPKGITSITFKSDMGVSPASGNLRTGEVFVNERLWQKHNYYERYFILKHEEGHIALQTRDEEKADLYAFSQYVKAGYPLSQSIYALSRGLNFQNPEHMKRLLLQIRRANNWDLYANGNKNLKPIPGKDPQTIMNAMNSYYLSENAEVNFLGLGKKARERRAEKKDAKSQRKIDKIAARGAARATVAATGGGFANSFGKVAGGIIDSAKGKFFGGGATDDSLPAEGADSDPVNKGGMKPMYWVLIAIIAALIVFFIVKKMKKKA